MQFNPRGSTANDTPAVAEEALPAQSVKGGSTQQLTQAATGGTLFECIDLTAAGDVNASQPGETAVGLFLRADKTPGWLAVLYDGVNTAIFPCPASGLDPTGVIGPAEYTFYPLSILSAGTKFITAASMTFGGGLGRARFVFANRPNPAPKAVKGFAQMRGVAVTDVETTTGGTVQTYNMPGGQLLNPLGLTALMSIEAGAATGTPEAMVLVPAIPPFTNPYQVPATLARTGNGTPPKRFPMPAIGPATSYGLTHWALNLGGTTGIEVMGVLWV